MELVPIAQAKLIKLKDDPHSQTYHVESTDTQNNETLIVIQNNDSKAFHQKTCGFESDLYNEGYRGYR